MADTEENTETETANASTAGTETTINTASTVPASSTTTDAGVKELVIEINDEDAAVDAESPAGEKPTVAQRASIDDTDQIAPTIHDEDATYLEDIGDPQEALTAENIFGEPRGELGPVIEFSSSESTVVEEEERSSSILSYLADLGLQVKKGPVDRAAYEEEYRTLRFHLVNLRRKNSMLHKKIGDYYKMRKMNQVFKELPIEVTETMMDKYETRAVAFHELLKKIKRQRDAISNELKDMRTLRDEQKEELVTSFTDMLAREHEIGRGLIDSRTGKTISNKLIERLSTRQQAKSDEIAVIRFSYIKRRDKIKEIEAKIKSLENVGGKLHLMDFEQLRMENQTYTDKIEDRDGELMRLRGRYLHALHSLAHIREKINTIQIQIANLHDEKISEDTNVNRARELLNGLKKQRDINRAKNLKLKTNTGILTYPKLLLDMERGMNTLEQRREQLEKLKVKTWRMAFSTVAEGYIEESLRRKVEVSRKLFNNCSTGDKDTASSSKSMETVSVVEEQVHIDGTNNTNSRSQRSDMTSGV